MFGFLVTDLVLEGSVLHINANHISPSVAAVDENNCLDTLHSSGYKGVKTLANLRASLTNMNLVGGLEVATATAGTVVDALGMWGDLSDARNQRRKMAVVVGLQVLDMGFSWYDLSLTAASLESERELFGSGVGGDGWWWWCG